VIFRARNCEWCGAEFAPHSSRQRRCDTCRQRGATEAGRCRDCGNPISGRARWGASWGGECDRAEGRVDALMMVVRSVS
jgi:predicted amidophosphoribosyltransferase